MAEILARAIVGVALAGGASSRMGRSKALMPFLGEPLVARVISRLRPQVAKLYLNARQDEAGWAGFGAPLAFDPPAWPGAGPLAGVAAAMALAAREGFTHLASAPCDAPFLPLDLVARLASGAPAAVAVSRSGLEPMFALWPVAALPLLEAALAEGRASPRAALLALGAAEVAFPENDAFANLNTPEEFAAAESRAKRDLLEAAAQRMGETL